MKKILLILFISCSLFASKIPDNVDTDIRTWINKNKSPKNKENKSF